MKRAAIAVGAVVAAWLVALLILGALGTRRQAERITSGLSESMQGSAAVGDVDLALIRGRLSIADLSVQRDDALGHLSLVVPEVRCELPPLGGALVDGNCRELAVRGVRLEISSAALFQLKRPKRPPLHAGRVVIDDAVLEFSPSAFLPSLGRIAIRIDHAEAGATVMRTPLSWLFALQALRATFELPAGMTLYVTYAGGVLGAAGSWFGRAPVTLPVTLPVASAFADGKSEIDALVALGKSVAEQLVEKRAQDWVNSML